MKVIASTIEFFKAVWVALRQIREELFRKKNPANVPSEQYEKMSAVMDDAAEHLIKNAETMGKIAHEMAVMEGLIDEMGLVTAKAKNLGITQKMIQPFSYKPSGLN